LAVLFSNLNHLHIIITAGAEKPGQFYNLLLIPNRIPAPQPYGIKREPAVIPEL
jgi:hypothetical protein